MSDASGEILFTRHEAGHGIVWLKDAYAMMSKARVQWLLLLLAYYVVLGIVDLVPVIGQLAVPILKPVFAVGFLAAAWSQERGGKPEIALLFRGFRANLRALLPLGVFLLAGITVAVMASSVIDDGRLVGMLANPPTGDDADKAIQDLLRDSSVQGGMLFAAVCAAPIMLAMWFAPALVVFQDLSAHRALAMSLRAALANWRPLTIYALVVSFFAVVVPGLFIAIVALILPASVGAILVFAVVFPYVFLLVATLHISDYVSYRDVFHAGEEATPDETPAA